MSSNPFTVTKKYYRNNFLFRTVITILLFAAVMTVLGLTVEHFFTARNLTNVLLQATPLALMAIGLSAVLITGGMDLSIPAVMALGGILGSMYMRDGGNPIAGSLIMAGVGLLCGCLNGYAVAYLHMIPFVVTLATQAIAMGVCVVITNSVSVLGLNESFLAVMTARPGGIPVPIIAVVAITSIVWLLSSKSIFGRWLYAVGMNADTAEVSGIPGQSVIFGAYAFAGLFAGLTAIVVTSRLASASPTMGQEGVVLNVVAASVVGGVSIYGGAGSFVGAVLGATVITLISNVMNLAQISYYATLVVKGLVIVVVVALDAQSKQR